MFLVEVVLEDISIRDMSLDALLKVTRPKVEGSLHLDQLFQSQDSDLDFFIFFSSAGSVAGRPGQGNYAAANLFMTALAEQRRRRGQVASVMHIGPIFGVGYITQQGLDLGSKLPSTMNSMFPISEHDFCQHFAEAVITGRSRSESSALEVTTGLAKFKSLQEAGPLLSHYTEDRIEVATDVLTASSKVPLILQLATARGRAQVTKIIREAFLLKLSTLFQIELSKLEQSELKALHLDEMGIDSLMAVEIRGWFFKTFQVNIPVLKILSGAGVADLIDTAAEMLPRQLVPMFDGEGLYSEMNGRDPPMQREANPTLQQTRQADFYSRPSVLSQRQQETYTVSEEENISFLGESDKSPGSNHIEEIATAAAKQQLLNKKEVGFPPSEDGESPLSQYRIATLSDEIIERDEWLGSPITPVGPQHQNDEMAQAYKTANTLNEKLFSLSFSQSLFWFSTAFSDDPTNLNLTGTFRLSAEIIVEDLKSAIIAVGQQHESLRTRFVLKDGQPMQSIMNSTVLCLEHYTIQCEDELASYISKIHKHVYDLEKGKTIRLALVSMSPNQHFFIIGVHHLAMDGQSFFPLMKDMLQHYKHDYQGMTARQYTNFSKQQHAEFASGVFKAELAFWKTELAEIPLPLPILRTSSLTSRPILQSYGNRHVDMRVDAEVKVLIKTLCRRCKATPFHFYLAIFRVLLCKYTGSGDFSIGIGDANRTEDLTGSIGDFVNLLPLVFHTDLSLPFDTLLQETRSKTFAALANSRVPFQLLLNE